MNTGTRKDYVSPTKLMVVAENRLPHDRIVRMYVHTYASHKEESMYVHTYIRTYVSIYLHRSVDWATSGRHRPPSFGSTQSQLSLALTGTWRGSKVWVAVSGSLGWGVCACPVVTNSTVCQVLLSSSMLAPAHLQTLWWRGTGNVCWLI